MAKFKVGDEVESLSDQSRSGTIVQVGRSHAGIQYYRVNFGAGNRPMVPEDDLRLFTNVSSPIDNLMEGRLGGYQEYQRLITQQRLQREHPLKNNIYSFNASRTRFFPYQFKPLLKFLESPQHRLLIADEVGLGKTIEAGLILMELSARQSVNHVLVVCPSSLTNKWQTEMLTRFGEHFDIFRANTFMSYLDQYEQDPDRTPLRGVISLESIRRDNVLARLDELAPDFDLVIVDEAHHMRNFGTKQRQAGELLGQSAVAMLMLTATPIHLGNENLYSLLNILDDEGFPSKEIAQTRFQDNEAVVRAQICIGQQPPRLEEANLFLQTAGLIREIQKNPIYHEVCEQIKELKEGFDDETLARQTLLETQRNLAELNLIGHVFTRTRKREVNEEIVERVAKPIQLTFTEKERKFYNAVTHYVRFQSREKTASPIIQQWLLNLPQRRVASSIPAMVRHYKTDLSDDFEAFPEDLDIETPQKGQAEQKRQFKIAKQRLREIIEAWEEDEVDSKYDAFLNILQQIKQEGKPLKIVVFAFFKDTLRYLEQRLFDDGFNCVLISGDVLPEERRKRIEQLRTDPSTEILLSSRVGSEGLDFQFCNTLFNYDLPWNPMEVEQRIGRLDRIGQESKHIRIYNFWIEGTIEERILGRLYERLDIFKGSIGDLEAILGDEIQTLERDILTQMLTEEQEADRIERTALALMRRKQDMESLESESAQFIGVDQYFNDEVEKIRNHRRYITGTQMQRFYRDFIRQECPRTRLKYDEKTQLGTLFPDEELKNFIREQRASNDLIPYLGNAKEGVAITFDSQAAFQHPKLDFINVIHPLTQAISRFYGSSDKLLINAHHVILKTCHLPPGFYFYFVYQLRIIAARGANSLEMIILNEEGEEACTQDISEAILGEMVENGQNPKGPGLDIDPNSVEDAYDIAGNIFYNRMEWIRKEQTRSNDAFLDRRQSSIENFYTKRIDKLQEILYRGQREGKQENYLRMRRGHITRLESERNEKMRDIENQRTVGVNNDELAAGILEVVEE